MRKIKRIISVVMIMALAVGLFSLNVNFDVKAAEPLAEITTEPGISESIDSAESDNTESEAPDETESAASDEIESEAPDETESEAPDATEIEVEARDDSNEIEAADVMRYEAEDAKYAGNLQPVGDGNFVIGGFDNIDGFPNWYVEFERINVPAEGTYTVVIGYDNGMQNDSVCSLSVNGESSGTVTFPSTGSWTQYDTISMEIPFNQGLNSIKFFRGEDQSSGFDLDYIEVEGAIKAPEVNVEGVEFNQETLGQEGGKVTAIIKGSDLDLEGTTYALTNDGGLTFLKPESDADITANEVRIAVNIPENKRYNTRTYHYQLYINDKKTEFQLQVSQEGTGGEKPSPRKVIDSSHPLYVVHYGWKDSVNTSVTQLWNLIPDDLKPYTAILAIAERSLINDGEVGNQIKSWIKETVEECEKNGIPVFLQQVNGETGPERLIPLDFWEELVANNKCLLGLNAAELYNNEDIPEYLSDSLEMLSSYGAFYMWTDTNLGGGGGLIQRYLQSDTKLLDNMRANKENVIMMNKESFADVTTDATNLGLWLSDICGNWGVSSDCWHWDLDGYNKLFGNSEYTDSWRNCLGMPEAMYGQDMLRVASEGGTCFLAEVGFYTTYSHDVLTPTYENVIAPIMRKMVDGTIRIPTKEEVMEKNQFAYQGRDAFSIPYESPYSNLYYSTGRYGTIPLLLPNLNEEELAKFKNVSAEPKDQAYLDSLYPEETWGTDTFATRTENQWFWMNSSENTDIYQGSMLNPQINKSEYFYIGSGPHTYAAIQESEDGFKGLIGNYRIDMDGIYTPYINLPFDSMNEAVNEFIYENLTRGRQKDGTLRETNIKISGTYKGGKPVLDISKGGENVNDFTYTESWDEETSLYKLTIMHNGPVNFEIKVDEPGAPRVPDTPKGLQADVLDGDSIDLKWEEVEGAYSYDVEANGEIYNVLRPQIMNIFTPDTEYTIRVRAKNAVGDSAWSDSVIVKTQKRYEAEDADTNAIKNYNKSSASNQGYVGGMDDPGKYVTFTVTVPKTQIYQVNLACAAGYGNATRSIYVDDVFVGEQLFPASSWDDYKVTQFALDLKAGSNNITVKTESSSVQIIDIDYLEVVLPTETDVDLTILKSVFQVASDLDKSKYTEESVQELEAVMAEADTLLKQDLQSIEQKDVDQMVVALLTAINQLEKKPPETVEYADVTALKAVLERVDSLDRSKYTADSLEMLDACYKLGQELLKLNPAVELQEIVSQVTKTIEQAILNLVTKPSAEPPVTETPSAEPPAGSSVTETTTVQRDSNSEVSSPQTGDRTNITIWLLLIGAAGIIAGISIKHRRK